MSYTDYLGLVLPSFVLDTALNKLKCIKLVDEQRTAFEKEISKCHVEVLWDEDPIRFVQCTAKSDYINERNLLRSSREDVEEIIQKFIEKILQFRFTEANRQNIKEALSSLNVADPSTVFVLFGDTWVDVVCFEGYKESDLNHVTDILNDFAKD